jgi:D-arabinose 1-dehydrogenase-like Zn-dependent alcohol dehydrogenase
MRQAPTDRAPDGIGKILNSLEIGERAVPSSPDPTGLHLWAQRECPPTQLIRGGKTIEGWAGVTPADSDDTLRFAHLLGVRAMIETYPLERAAEAYARMMSGNAEFRVVLTMGMKLE